MKRRRSKIVVAAGGTLVLLGLALTAGPFIWPYLNCTVTSIDIESGDCRKERYLFFFRVADRIESTPLSVMRRAMLGEARQREWRPVTTIIPLDVSSPNHSYHRSLGASTLMADTLSYPVLSNEARKVAIGKFFELLTEANDDYRATRFSHELWKLVTDIQDRGTGPISSEQVLGLADCVRRVEGAATTGPG